MYHKSNDSAISGVGFGHLLALFLQLLNISKCISSPVSHTIRAIYTTKNTPDLLIATRVCFYLFYRSVADETWQVFDVIFPHFLKLRYSVFVKVGFAVLRIYGTEIVRRVIVNK